MPLIKRYANRKLYDTESKRYITLDGIAEMIRQQQEVTVIDHETGEDITALTQAQIIFEQERKLRSGIPHAVFTNLIQTGSDTLSQVWRALISPDELKKAVNAEIEKRVQVLMQTGQLGDEDGIRMLDLLLASPPEPEAAKSDRAAPLSGLEKLIKQHAPSQEQLEQLTKQVEALTAEVERLTKLKLPRLPKPPTKK
ncbi:hypothetical protein TFLX_06253 [Thermoflexales bacterium]|nr:hypothetical protein TFLX_06253 [Thermoflexales bacterium]